MGIRDEFMGEKNVVRILTKHNSKFFPAVQWQDGLLSTWINSKPYAEDLDQQADRLYQLQLAGYELSEAYIRMIDARSCRTLVGSLFYRQQKGQ